MRFLLAVLLALAAQPALAQRALVAGQDHEPKTLAYARAFAAGFAGDEMLHSAIRQSTEAHRRLDWNEQRALDRQYRDERADRETDGLYGAIVNNRLSDWLKEQMAAAPDGAVTEILVIDGLGWNVGQTGDVADFFQGDELQWQDIVPGGPNAYAVSELEDNGSDGRSLALVSLPIIANNRNIGVLTLGIDTSKIP